MRTVPLGDTGVNVSAVCLGAMLFGSSTDRAASFQILDQYVDAGGSFVDTANIYAWWVGGCRGGESETLLGEWMRLRANRPRMFIATKVGFEYPGVERGLRADQIAAECEKSLRRLGTDYVDLYYAHVDDRATPLEETLEAFDRLVQAGKVRFIGASNFLAWRLAEARWVSRVHGWAQYCCIQQRHTYLRPQPGASFDPQIVANEDLFDLCRSQGVTLLAYSPLLGGAYTRPDRPLDPQYRATDTQASLEALRAVALETGATPNQVVLAWLMASDPPAIPLVAGSTMDQIHEDLGALRLSLSPEQMERLTAASA